MPLTSTAEKIKGQIPYPCCPKEKAMAYESSHGRASYKCPNCGKFAVFDFDEMVAYPCKPARGAAHIFQSIKTSID
jgi:transposase-like protein|nr:MAG TPA: cysteine-rich protein [Caudoviricetes sp.]